ncbi:hypothetical protein K0U83_03280 [bacterium]|nr:hypothetical protein [bacterium]
MMYGAPTNLKYMSYSNVSRVGRSPHMPTVMSSPGLPMGHEMPSAPGNDVMFTSAMDSKPGLLDRFPSWWPLAALGVGLVVASRMR